MLAGRASLRKTQKCQDAITNVSSTTSGLRQTGSPTQVCPLNLFGEEPLEDLKILSAQGKARILYF